MPQPLPRLHLPHSVACDNLKDLPELSHQACTSAPSNANLDCKMNVRKLLESIPQRQRDAEGDSDSGCTIRARKRHDRHDGRAVMVFRRIGAGKKKRPCGMPHCPTCGVFWQIYIEDLERYVPSLVSNQSSSSNARKAMCASSAASIAGSTPSTLTELTEISKISQELLGQTSESGLLTPASTCSSATLSSSSAASTRSTLLKSPKDNGVPSPASSETFVEFNKNTAFLFGDRTPVSSSISTLTELTENGHGSSVCSHPAPFIAASLSAISTLTDFSEIQSSSSLSTPPSSLSSLPPTLSTTTATITTSKSPYKMIKVRRHRSMIEMSDGSRWLPPTLERVQAYISSQGQRRLARTTRAVVAAHADRGSRVALKYENAILKVDLRAGRKSETRKELLGYDEDEDMEDAEE